MDKEYFYINYVDDSNRENGGEVMKIDVDYIDQIAFFATTLEPQEAESDIDGYAAALASYYSGDERNEIYDKLVNSLDGRLFLNVNIALSLVEKDFRLNGVRDETVELYDKCLTDYRAQIEYSKTLLNKLDK